MKYKVGQQVRIIKKSPSRRDGTQIDWNKGMNKWLSGVMTIRMVHPDGYYYMEEDLMDGGPDRFGWRWYEEMIDGVAMKWHTRIWRWILDMLDSAIRYAVA